MTVIVVVGLCPKYADCHSTAAKRRDDKSEICKKNGRTAKKSGLKILGFRIVSSTIKHNTSPSSANTFILFRSDCLLRDDKHHQPTVRFLGVLGGGDSLAQYACVGQSHYH
jgi:hypothetical protein